MEYSYFSSNQVITLPLSEQFQPLASDYSYIALTKITSIPGNPPPGELFTVIPLPNYL